MQSLTRFADRFAPALAFLGVLLAWEGACRLLAIPIYVLPPPTAILASTGEIGVARWGEHLFATIQVAIVGYLVAILCAIPLAVAITGSRLMSRTLLPWLIIIQSTPIVAIAPIIVVTLGAGMVPRVVITTLIAFFPLVIATATGLASVPDELLELSRSLRASRSREYWQIRMPYAMPHIFSALKVAITLAVIGAVVAEFVAADVGLGYLILYATSSFKVPMAFASLGLLVGCSLTLYGIIVLLQRTLCPWSLSDSGAK